MAATNFNTKNDTFRKLMGNGLTYRVPRFQRDYSWGEEEWEDLWLDIMGTIDPGGEPAHYMGYLVLQTNDDKQFDIIDGQQRLTTLSVLVLAALRVLKKFAGDVRNQQRLDQIRSSYIGFVDPVTLVPRPKLTLNRNNDSYYQAYLVALADHLPQRGFPASVHGLRKAFEWFERKLTEYVRGSSEPGVEIARFIETASDRLFFTVITVDDELNAYKVFETLNARGVRLSATDLLKNYLFSVLHRGSEHPHELDTLEERWEEMVGRLGSESFPDFLRMHWNSREGFARQTELFKVIRSRVSTRELVFGLLRSMDEDIDTYVALTQPDGANWPESWRDQAQKLRMFSVRQPFPMLMAAKRRLTDDQFEVILRATVVLAFRYNVIGGQHTGEQERVYNSVALKIARGELAKASGILDSLRPIYVSDDAFRSAFAQKDIRTTASRNRKIVRYILFALERQESGQDLDFDSIKYNLEHVLPEHPEANWGQFRDEDVELFVFRLGNMAMLEESLNRQIGNSSFDGKKEVYQESAFHLTRQLAQENEDWTVERIVARQKKLAHMATGVWRISQLD